MDMLGISSYHLFAEIEETGETTVYCDKLYSIVSNLQGMVCFEKGVDDMEAVIRPEGKKIRFKLRTMTTEKYPYVEKSDEEIKKEFIESFREEKWEEEEALTPLMDLSFKLCDFLGIEAVPILFEEMEEDARYYNDLDYIGISNDFVHDEIEARKSLINIPITIITNRY